jgi:hypothetical protein
MSKFIQTAIQQGPIVVTMVMKIISIEKDDPDGIIVTFSDGTYGAYVVEELLELRPYRERFKLPAPIASPVRAPGEKPRATRYLEGKA